MKTNRRKKAFTLIELLVVVLIIGILAAVALPQYQKAVQRSRFVPVFTYLDAVKKAEEIYYAQNGVYAGDMTLLTVEAKCPKGWTCSVRDDGRIEAKNNGLSFITSCDHRSKFSTTPDSWNGITYCYGGTDVTSKNEKICKSMGPLIPEGHNSLGNRYYVSR